MSHANQKDDNRNIIVGATDYTPMIKQQINGAIIEQFTKKILSSKHLNIWVIFNLIRAFSIALVMKMILEESSTFLLNLKISNILSVKYFVQKIRYSEISYDIVLKNMEKSTNSAWFYSNKQISMVRLSTYLETKAVYVSTPGVYYYEYFGKVIKVIVEGVKGRIIFLIPNLEVIKKYIEKEIIYKYSEIIVGSNTRLCRITGKGGLIGDLEPLTVSFAMPTENYKILEKEIQVREMIRGVLGTNTVPLCANFDGEPGTGKTTFGSYIAKTGIYDYVIIINMLTLASNAGSANVRSFNDVISTIDKKIPTTIDDKGSGSSDFQQMNIMIIFDEIEKWLHNYIKITLHKMREEARKKTSNNGKDGVSIVEGADKLTGEEELQYTIQIKEEFLNQLYNLIDGHLLSPRIRGTFIFNTNDFESIFEHCDNKKYEAIRNRFCQYHFDKSGKVEIIEYLENITKKLQSFNDDHGNDKEKIILKRWSETISQYDKSILDDIPEQIKISYRELFKITCANYFIIPKIVAALNVYCINNLKSNDLIEDI